MFRLKAPDTKINTRQYNKLLATAENLASIKHDLSKNTRLRVYSSPVRLRHNSAAELNMLTTAC